MNTGDSPGFADQYDAVVVGAGPYGLSTAAHLLRRGLRIAVYGKPLELWRDHMPKGMLLRSHWWATNLSDPHRQYGFERFLRESAYVKRDPVPREAFIEYGLWFQKRAVPHVDETYVSSIEQRNGGFLLTLQDGRQVTSAAVVLAVGLAYYAHRPEPYNHLPAELVSHSCDHHDFSRFNGKQVIVIGGGQSAIESTALLHEAGARVHVVSRRAIAWCAPDRSHKRSTIERILAPSASIACGWENWILDHAPYCFYRLPQRTKDGRNSKHSSGAADWLRDRIGAARLHEGHAVVALDQRHGHVQATVSDGEKVTADHLILATGYKVDLNMLTMIHPSLRVRIRTDMAVPLLNKWFESTVPGLYFVGLTSLRAFGPLFRFVAGCRATARRVAAAVARQRVEQSQVVAFFNWSASPSCRRLGIDQTSRSFTR